jgi:hypothetical protein
MKKNALIVPLLMSALSGAFVLIANGQDKDKATTNKRPSPVLIADETTLTYGINEVKIECDNATIFRKIHETHSQLFKRFTCTWKYNHGTYKHYVIYIDRGDSEILIKWAKKNL